MLMYFIIIIIIIIIIIFVSPPDELKLASNQFEANRFGNMYTDKSDVSIYYSKNTSLPFSDTQ